MATLEQIQGGSLVPDFTGAAGLALKVFGTGRERAKEAEEQRLTGVVAGAPQALRDEERGADPTAGPTVDQQSEALLRLTALNPQAAQVIRGHLERKDRAALKQVALETEQAQKNAVVIKQAKDCRGMRQRIMTIADQKRALGQSVEGPVRLLGLSEEKLRLELDSRLTQLTDAKTLVAGVKVVEERDRVAKVERFADAAQKLLQGDIANQDKGFKNLIQAAQSNNNPEAAAEFQRIADLPLGAQQAELRRMVSRSAGDRFIDLKDATGNLIGRENVKTGKKELFTAAQRGLPTGTETPKEPIFLEVDIIGPDGKPTGETEQHQALTSFDPKRPAGQKWKTVIKKLDGRIISKSTGRTAEASDAAAVKLAEDKTKVVQAVLIDTQGKLERIKKRSQSIEGRLQSTITEGLTAVKTLPNLRRTRVLLEQVKTGGLALVRNKLDQFFGTEGASEAELNNAMGKAVLSQLKATFGAQFTEKEGKLLQDIEANFGKSTAGNVVLIDRAIQAQEIRARIGLNGAKTAQDENAIFQFNEFFKQVLGPEATATPTPETQTITAEQKARLEALRKKQR